MTEDPRIRHTRERALAAAEELFVTDGVDGVTYDGISARTGIARSTLYRHWENRDALLGDLLSSLHVPLIAPPAELPVEERLRRVLGEFASLVRDQAMRGVLLAIIGAGSHPRLQEAATRVRLQHGSVVRPIMDDAIEEGLISAATDPAEAFLQLFGPILLASLSPMGAPGDAGWTDRLVEGFLFSHRP